MGGNTGSLNATTTCHIGAGAARTGIMIEAFASLGRMRIATNLT